MERINILLSQNTEERINKTFTEDQMSMTWELEGLEEKGQFNNLRLHSQNSEIVFQSQDCENYACTLYIWLI